MRSTGCASRRADLGLPAGDDAALVIDPVTGERVTADAMPLHLRKARLTRVSIEANSGICRGMLRHRYNNTSRTRRDGRHPTTLENTELIKPRSRSRRTYEGRPFA